MGSIKDIRLKADQISRKSKALLAYAVLTAAASLWATTVKAQTFSEWFRQGSTQKKYLLQQIAALQVYATYIKQGNNIAHNGLGSISGSLKGENSLHATYYNNLKMVSLAVKNDPQIADILQWQQDILSRMNGLEKTANLTGNEQTYILSVKAALFKDCNQQITGLQNVVSDSKLQMSDAERLKQIGIIYQAMQDNYRFAATFSAQVKVYAVQRVQENNDAVTGKNLYGIH